ncbi:MAG: hypothetical protein LBT03_00065 [Holosporales bacterium]|nr:hypothetical protein [Holosporales bacterium]
MAVPAAMRAEVVAAEELWQCFQADVQRMLRGNPLAFAEYGDEYEGALQCVPLPQINPYAFIAAKIAQSPEAQRALGKQLNWMEKNKLKPRDLAAKLVFNRYHSRRRIR